MAYSRSREVATGLNQQHLQSNFGSNIKAVLGFKGVAHGFRTTFRTWCQANRIIEEVSELSLKHANTDATRAAYARDQLLPERRSVINAYEKWTMKGDSGQNKKIVSINKRRRAN